MHLTEIRNAYKILVGKRKKKRALGRCGCNWEDYIKMKVMEKAFGCGLDSSNSGQGPAARLSKRGSKCFGSIRGLSSLAG